MIFRSMNASASGRPVSTPPTRDTPPSSVTPSLSPQPSTDWGQYAVNRFLENFVEPPSTAGPGYLEFLPDLVSTGSDSLQESLLAAAVSNLANISCMRQLEVKSRVHYGRALRALRIAMDNPNTATADDTLASILLLQKYEVSMGGPLLCRMPK
jgi:hypothetical protein